MFSSRYSRIHSCSQSVLDPNHLFTYICLLYNVILIDIWIFWHMAPHNCICCGCQRQRNENLIVRIRPAAIALNYSIKKHAERRRTPDIRIRKIALMWSSLTLAAIINCFRMRPAWKSRQPPASCVNIISCSWMWILSIVCGWVLYEYRFWRPAGMLSIFFGCVT